MKEQKQRVCSWTMVLLKENKYLWWDNKDEWGLSQRALNAGHICMRFVSVCWCSNKDTSFIWDLLTHYPRHPCVGGWSIHGSKQSPSGQTARPPPPPGLPWKQIPTLFLPPLIRRPIKRERRERGRMRAESQEESERRGQRVREEARGWRKSKW